MSEPDDVGYGKPPKKTQFKKGQSGNPKGRPKGAKSLKTVLRAELESKIEVKEQGRKIKVSRLEALAKRLVTDALNGNSKALAELLKQVNLHLLAPDEPVTVNRPAKEEDAALLMAFAARMLKEQQGGSAVEPS